MRVEIDRHKLSAEIRKTGHTLQSASREIGFNENYLSSALNAGAMPESTTKLINHLFGIAVEKYAKGEKEMRNTNYMEIDGEKLSQILRDMGWSNRNASFELGRSSGFLKSVVSSGKISNADAKNIYYTFGIEPERYQKVETPEKKEDLVYLMIKEALREVIREELK